jgi:2-alkyl-3-oxoalkanoate reductase
MERIAVTGFPGWLTCALFDNLARRGELSFDEAVLLAYPSSVERARDLAAAYPWKSTVCPFDLATTRETAQSLRGADVLVHTAGVIHVKGTRDWYDVNTQGTIRLAREAQRAGVRRFVFISSIAAAGKSWPDRDLRETDTPRPMHHYGRSKLLAEQALLEIHDPGTFDVVILRPSMFYGPPVPQRHVEIYKRILYGRMPLIGGGRYNRSLVHVDNLTQAVELAMVSEKAPGQTYFIVDRSVYTTYDVVEAMAEALGTRARYITLPAALAEGAYQFDRAVSALGIYIAPIHLVGESHWHQSASCEKAMRELGYKPTIELHDGMRNAIQWCRERGKL